MTSIVGVVVVVVAGGGGEGDAPDEKTGSVALLDQMPAPDVHDVVDAYWLDRRRRGHVVISLPPFFLRPVFLLWRRSFMKGEEFSYYFNSGAMC